MTGRVICLLLLLLPKPALSETVVEAETARLSEIGQVEESLDEEARRVSGDLILDGSYDVPGALSRLWTLFRNKVEAAIIKETNFTGKLLMISLIGSVAAGVTQNEKSGRLLDMAVCCTGAVLLAGSAESVIPETCETLYRLSDYGKAVFPAFFMTVAASGSSLSASVKFASVSFVTNLFMELTRNLILPTIYAYLAVVISLSLTENALLMAAEKFLKWCAVSMMTLFTGGFCMYITLSGLISGSADASSVKAAKTVLSATLPVVGGILSDSASAILSAASVIKNSAGVFCLIAVCAICTGPFAVLLVKMLLLKAAAALSEMGSSTHYAHLLSSIGSAMGMLLGIVGSYGIMLFFSIMSGLRAAA